MTAIIVLVFIVLAVGLCVLRGVIRAIPAIIFWMVFAVSCASLVGCAPMTPAEHAAKEYRQQDRLVRCRDFVRACPVFTVTNGDRVYCGQRMMYCPDLPHRRF